ncbi:hypothetical protein HHL28_02820 [Aerophototrophica crusticola]|uniref:Peptidase A2 domain-containing protein n=1 Tax=Aerophototrophica crusticola TaxID=1709002 RepID=A0A858R468_9PROT|nr:hypothetical protein HHL28_02820 [Rhodospirillaceae bacterium B3]
MRALRLLLLAACGMALSGCLVVDALRMQRAQEAAPHQVAAALPVELPFQDRDGLVIIPGTVNGKATLDFVLDTGAPVTVLLDGGEPTAPLALDLSKAEKLGDSPASPVGSILFGFGLDFGPIAIRDLPLVGVPLGSMPCQDRFHKLGFRGVIGMDLFRRFVVEVDFDANRLRLHDPASYRYDRGGTVLPLTFHDRHIYVDGGVTLPDGTAVPGRFHVDTGKNSGLMLLAGKAPGLVMPAEGRSRTACLVNGTIDQREGAPVTLALGGERATGETPLYEGSGRMDQGDSIGTVGMGTLRRWNLVIDYPGKRLILEPRKAR